MTRPAVSIVMPCYNAAAFLAETLASVVAQSYADWEVLLVDDGSRDDPEPIVCGLGDERLRYRRIEASGGPSRPRNLAIAEARGDYVFFFDADDIMLPGKLAAQVAALEADPEVGLCFTNFRLVDRTGAVTDPDFLAGYATFQRLKRRARGPAGRIDRHDFSCGLLRANFVGTSSVAVRRTLLERVGGFDESLSSSEDVDLWLRLACSADCGYVDIIGHSYRRHAASIMHQFDSRHPQARIEVIRRHLERVDDPEARRSARRRLAENYVALGYILEVQGDPAGARRNYLTALRLAPSAGAALGAAKCTFGRLWRRPT